MKEIPISTKNYEEICKKKIDICTEILSIIDFNTTSLNIGAVFARRAMAFLTIEDYDAALKDFQQALKFAQERRDDSLVMQCHKYIDEIRLEKRKAEISAGGGEKADRLQAMEKQAQSLMHTGPQADAAFQNLFSNLKDNDPDIRLAASKFLADSSEAIERLISIYQQCLNSDARRTSLAGRVLDRKIAKGSTNMFSPDIAQMFYGLAFSVLPCSCVHCGTMNLGIAAPPWGRSVAYYHKTDDKAAYAVHVLCDKCSKEFFVVWYETPGR